MRVDMIMLQDLIEFQDISFKLGDGYVWRGNRSHKIRTEIEKLFDLRAEYKKTGNPTQQVIKLIMNSAYGKSIQKPIKTFLHFVKKDEYEWFINDRYYQIHCDYPIENGNHLIELTKQKSNQFNNVLFGVSVLSMSKRIMNEVMCLAEDLGINIYYQDTDSMHIERNKVNILAEAFKNKYDRELERTKLSLFENVKLPVISSDSILVSGTSPSLHVQHAL
jgi:DNA polymerase elongation subunit (family B)